MLIQLSPPQRRLWLLSRSVTRYKSSLRHPMMNFLPYQTTQNKLLYAQHKCSVTSIKFILICTITIHKVLHNCVGSRYMEEQWQQNGFCYIPRVWRSHWRFKLRKGTGQAFQPDTENKISQRRPPTLPPSFFAPIYIPHPNTSTIGQKCLSPSGSIHLVLSPVLVDPPPTLPYICFMAC